MTKQPANTKAELLATLELTWNSLNAILNRLTVPQKTTLTDAQGWTVKDHLIHLAAWERSIVFFLQGRPRHAGLGVEQALYEDGSADDINAAIFQQCKEMPLTEVLVQFHTAHEQLMRLLRPLTDADLHQPYHHYLPDELGDDRLAIEVIYSNTIGHFEQHMEWIETLAGNI
ncbi:MAG: ClbS/DfsB family four-helix bundle protein [Chloroflexota bacterium]